MQERILVRGVNWIGDAVMTMPAIAALRNARPEARIELLVKPWVAALFEHDPNVDEVILHEGKGIGPMLSLVNRLRKRKYTSALLLQNAFEAAALAFLAGIPQRIGYARDGRSLLLSNPIPYDNLDRNMHHIDYYLHLLKSAGIRAPFSEPWIYLTLDERLWAQDKVREFFKEPERPLVGINPGAAFGSAKQWFPDRFAKVARLSVEELGANVIVFGGPGEREIAGTILKEFGPAEGRIVSVAGDTSLRELASLISRCHVLLTNDSGPMHMAGALKTPVVGIFGSTDYTLTSPIGASNIFIKKDIDCSPCFKRTCPDGGLKCMEAIGAEEVFERLRSLMPTRRAVFFDVSGTLTREVNENGTRGEEFHDLGPIGALKEHGYEIFGFSSHAEHGPMGGEAMKAMEGFFASRGFRGFYFCCHSEEKPCICGKPEPGLLMRAKVEHGVDLGKSFVVGDAEADIHLAKAAGARSILIGGEPLYGATWHAPTIEDAVKTILHKS